MYCGDVFETKHLYCMLSFVGFTYFPSCFCDILIYYSLLTKIYFLTRMWFLILNTVPGFQPWLDNIDLWKHILFSMANIPCRCTILEITLCVMCLSASLMQLSVPPLETMVSVHLIHVLHSSQILTYS